MLVIKNVLDAKMLRALRVMIDEAQFIDGKKTAGFRAKRVKKNEQLARDDKKAKEVKRRVLERLRLHPEFKSAALPRRVQSPLISRYQPGMEYGRHSDDALMGTEPRYRTDLSVTLFLSEPDSYKGGELVVSSNLGEQRVKLPAGSAFLYASGNLHWVAPVEEGERLAAVTWVESYIRDHGQRELLYDLHKVCRRLSRDAADWLETDLAFKTYSNLLRRWSEN